MLNLILAILAAIVSVVLLNYPDLAGNPEPVGVVFLLCIGIWQTLDGFQRLIYERRSARFEFLLAVFAYFLVFAFTDFWPDAVTRPLWIVVTCSIVVSNIIGFLKKAVRRN